MIIEHTDVCKDMKYEVIGVDEGIEKLIETMNRTGWIKTISSCEGHEGDEHHDRPYVSFACKMNKLIDLTLLIGKLEEECDVEHKIIIVDFNIVTNPFTHGSQDEMKKGWIALNLTIEILDDDFETTKIYLFKRLIELIDSLG
jgi:tRNA(Phe) wybutosine-synthesizing methylase Tyw3